MINAQHVTHIESIVPSPSFHEKMLAPKHLNIVIRYILSREPTELLDDCWLSKSTPVFAFLAALACHGRIRILVHATH